MCGLEVLCGHTHINPKAVYNACSLVTIVSFPPTANAIVYSAQYLANNPIFRGWFYNSTGGIKQAGDIVQRPEYSALLSAIAKEGPEIVYNGSIAREIVDEV